MCGSLDVDMLLTSPVVALTVSAFAASIYCSSMRFGLPFFRK